METSIHTLANLFAQLGLPSEQEEIQNFLDQHRPLPNKTPLHEAAFWSPAQSSFLCEEVLNDADWAELVDTLNERLRA
ncbi:MAG: DUF2789 domain-containing protein [Sulfuritalea sp.]|nr:DUF2789 domain-containing protein [Sulfuritalea sp.]